MSKKKTKIPAVVISSREAMIANVNLIVEDKLHFAGLTVKMEKEIAAIQERYQDRLTDLGQQIQSREAGVQLYCEQHRADLFPDKKSIDLTLAIVGFRETPYRVEKIKSKDTWDDVAAKLAALVLEDGTGDPVFVGDNYVTYADPAVSKATLLRDRTLIPPEALKAAGIRFDFDELFYIEPKSEVIEGIAKEAA